MKVFSELLTLRLQSDHRLPLLRDDERAFSFPDPESPAHRAWYKWHRCDLTCKCPNRFESLRWLKLHPDVHYCWKRRWEKKEEKIEQLFSIVKCKPVPDELCMHLLNPVVPQSTYTSTRIGKFASRSSSRQLGGKRICTEARVPCVSGISNVFILGRAISSSFFENCFLVSYSTFTSRWVFAECTPVF